MIVYDKFWLTLQNKGISQYELINKHSISSGTLQRMRENGNMRLSTIERLCCILQCSIDEIMEYREDVE